MEFRREPTIPPFRFSIVEHGIYRGAYPTLKNYRFLERLQLRHIISLIPEPPIHDLVEFCKWENITSTWIKVKKWDESIEISRESVKQLLEILINPFNLPVYIHCLDGKHVTGLVIMCLRKLQHYNSQVVFTNYSRYTEENISKMEKDFYESFNLPIEIPRVIPTWLWGGIIYQHHPTIPLITTEKKMTSEEELSDVPLNMSRNKSGNSFNNEPIEPIEKFNQDKRYSNIDLLMVQSSILNKYLNINDNKMRGTTFSRRLEALSLSGMTMKSMKTLLHNNK